MEGQISGDERKLQSEQDRLRWVEKQRDLLKKSTSDLERSKEELQEKNQKLKAQLKAERDRWGNPLTKIKKELEEIRAKLLAINTTRCKNTPEECRERRTYREGLQKKSKSKARENESLSRQVENELHKRSISARIEEKVNHIHRAQKKEVEFVIPENFALVSGDHQHGNAGGDGMPTSPRIHMKNFYHFGTRVLEINIFNDELMVTVSGSHMLFESFVWQFGQREQAKWVMECEMKSR